MKGSGVRVPPSALASGVEISVRVIPRAKREEIAGERDGVLLVRVRAPPVEGKANEAVCRLLAKRLGVGVRSVAIVRGTASREKLVRVEGLAGEEVRRRLARPGPRDGRGA